LERSVFEQADEQTIEASPVPRPGILARPALVYGEVVVNVIGAMNIDGYGMNSFQYLPKKILS